MSTKKPTGMPDRFWAKVRIGKPTECWEWQAALSTGGYGRFLAHDDHGQPRLVQAHRLSWELLNGSIPSGLEMDHLCRNRKCVNPAHLEPVTPEENKRRGLHSAYLNAGKTHCKRGHEFTDENTYVRPKSGQRICRTCDAMRARKYRAKKSVAS